MVDEEATVGRCLANIFADEFLVFVHFYGSASCGSHFLTGVVVGLLAVLGYFQEVVVDLEDLLLKSETGSEGIEVAGGIGVAVTGRLNTLCYIGKFSEL